MSFVLPSNARGGPQAQIPRSARRSVAPIGADAQRAKQEESQQHEQLKNELQFLMKKQAERIEKLKLDSAVQLEHHSTLRRLELERRKENAEKSISSITPRLEVVRTQWNHAKQQNQGYEMQWGSMRTQFQSVKARVDALKDQIEDGRQTADNTRKSLKEMREHLHKLDRDKASLRANMKRALECLVIDDNFLKARVAEEEAYHNQLQQALQAMQTEYHDSQAQHQHEFTPLEEDARVLAAYLEEMQMRTRELQRFTLELEGKASTIEDHWIEDVHSAFEGLERGNHMNGLKNIVLTLLEQQIKEYKESGVQPRPRTGHMDQFWLSNAVAVWEAIVREVTQEKQKMQIRDENSQLLSRTSQQCQQAKAQLATLKSKVDGSGNQRKQLFQEIADLHYYLYEKKEAEEQMVKYVQEIAAQLDEDLSQVLHIIRKEGFDDYVSSTDEDDVVEEGEFATLREEGNDDIAAIVSSIDLDPDDPSSTDALKQMAHRPEGPLREFAAARSQYLQRSQRVANPTVQKNKRLTMETLERSLMGVQVRVTDEVINFAKQRSQQIQQGLLDPKQERVQADPRYIEQAREMTNRIDRWIQQQKDNPSRPVLKSANQELVGSPSSIHGANSSQQKIVIDGARVPPDVARSNPVAKATYFTTNAVRGFNFMMIPRRAMGAQLRQVFVSRDLTRIIARRVGEGHNDEDLVMRIADVTNILCGHKTEVFRDTRALSRQVMKEELAFSIVTHLGTSFDIECESADDRNFWANIFAWVVNESRASGVLNALTAAGKVQVIDTMNRTAAAVEPRDRSVLQVQITP